MARAMHSVRLANHKQTALCIMNKPLLLNPTVDAFNALHDQMQCAIH